MIKYCKAVLIFIVILKEEELGLNFVNYQVNQQQDWTPANQITSGDGRYVEGKLERTSITKQDDFRQAGEFYAKLSHRLKKNILPKT